VLGRPGLLNPRLLVCDPLPRRAVGGLDGGTAGPALGPPPGIPGPPLGIPGPPAAKAGVVTASVAAIVAAIAAVAKIGRIVMTYPLLFLVEKEWDLSLSIVKVCTL